MTGALARLGRLPGALGARLARSCARVARIRPAPQDGLSGSHRISEELLRGKEKAGLLHPGHPYGVVQPLLTAQKLKAQLIGPVLEQVPDGEFGSHGAPD